MKYEQTKNDIYTLSRYNLNQGFRAFQLAMCYYGFLIFLVVFPQYARQAGVLSIVVFVAWIVWSVLCTVRELTMRRV